MNQKSLRVLEFNKIIELLKSKASSSLGLKYIEELVPSSDFEEVKYMQQETSETQSILTKRGYVGLQGIHDIEDKVKRAGVGASLDPGSLIMIADTLRAARTLRNSLSGSDEEDFNYPIIQSLSNGLYAYREIEDAIYNAIISELEISDNASSTLRDIRRRIVQKNQSIRSKLNSIISSTTYQKYLQDAIISVRGDRFVVPVKAEYRSQVAGIVHDQSSSGATLFIEPMSIVDMNNELRQLRLSEQEEIERILQELSAMVGEVSEDLISNQEILGRLDFAFAKGKLSMKMRGVEPTLNKDKFINIKNGRHPLLDRKTVVPNSVYLGRDFHTLVITGPNTGGKTVTIKTVGLFALMTQSGLHISADYGSSMCVYDNIFADIGDEQSIEQSLSTFSSHMTNIVTILESASFDSLILFDELGSGTDPTEGAALAVAIIETLNKRGCRIIATTHYSELKGYALRTVGVENASVEFDVETLKPTYRLLIGVPGKSNAFEISKRLGLSNDVILKAKDFMSEENLQFEDLIRDLQEKSILANRDAREAKRIKDEAEALKKKYDEKLKKLDIIRDKVYNEARQEAKQIISDAKDEADEIVKAMRELEKMGIAEGGRNRLEEERRKLKASLEEKEAAMIKSRENTGEAITKVTLGMEAFLPSLNQRVIIVSNPDNKGDVQVEAGIMKISVKLKDLRKVPDEPKKKEKRKREVKLNMKSVDSRIDLRGMDSEEACYRTDKYLDEAYLGNLGEVTIVHGKGTGILRKAINDMLKRHPHVKSYRLGVYGEGGDGVTIVELK